MFGINTMDKILLCKLWEKSWQQQQECARPGEADQGNYLDKTQDLDCIKVVLPQEHRNPHQTDQDEEGPAGHHRIPPGGDIFA